MRNNTFVISSNHTVYIVGYNRNRSRSINYYDNNQNCRSISDYDNNQNCRSISDYDKNNIPRLIKGLYDIKMVDSGSSHVLCLDFTGNIFSFGDNGYGQLGLGKDPDQLIRTHIPQKIDIPLCRQIACGTNFSVCLTKDNVLYSFGTNKINQCGLNNDINYNAPQLIPNLHNIEYIVCGGYHSICKTYDNTYYGWGSNDFGQLGYTGVMNMCQPTLRNDYPDDIISIKCGGCHTLLLTLEGKVYSFGSNSGGHLGLNDNSIQKTNIPTLIRSIPEIRRIECGDDYSMCIDVNDDLWLFGENYYGQLGLGDNEDRIKPTKHPTLSNIMDISSRGDSTFIKTFDHKIFAFGFNSESQLGIETSGKNQLIPIQVFQGNEDIWKSFIGQSKQKSARK